MDKFEIYATVIGLIAYTAFSVWAITKFKTLFTGVAGSLCLATGSIGVYYAAPIVAAALLWLIKAVFILCLIALVLHILGG